MHAFPRKNWQTVFRSSLLSGSCRFQDCAHVCEKGCGVLAAVQDGSIAESRHASYVAMYEIAKSERTGNNETGSDFSGGAFEKPDWVTLPKDAMILCADSGLRHARALGISPDWVLGDFDSSSEQPEGSLSCGIRRKRMIQIPCWQ